MATAVSLNEQLVFVLLQYLKEENLHATAHTLEQETGVFFDKEYFEILVVGGDLLEAEKYLLGFIRVLDDKLSINIYFEIRKQMYLEALDDGNGAKVLDVLEKDLKLFASLNEELYEEITHLLTLQNFRSHSSLSSYGDPVSGRKVLMTRLKALIEANPLLCNRIKFPEISESRLRRLINQGLNWQHCLCRNPLPDPSIKTIFEDHMCCLPNTLATQSIDEDTLMGMPGLAETQSQSYSSNILDEFPMTVGQIFDMESSPTSMDFHPVEQTILLVGTNTGDIELREVISSTKLLAVRFCVWNRDAKENIVNDPHISVTRTLWSTDGSFFGVAFSREIVQIYSYLSASNILKQIEIHAHVGSVNDLAFSKPYEKQLIITCGDDKLIKVWDITSGVQQYTFDGHGSPIYSLCAHAMENISFLYSVSTIGEINAWLFDNSGPRLSHETPAHCCVRMAYTADGKRLFLCGTNNEGESRIVEWNENEGFMMRNYQGLGICSSGGVVKFDIYKNRCLAAGDEHLIKVWDIENIAVLTTIDADGDLLETPNICFNTEGMFMAVFANNNRIKILANNDGLQLLKSTHDSVNVRTVAETTEKVGIGQMPAVTAATDECLIVSNDPEQDESLDDSDDEESEMEDCSVLDDQHLHNASP